MGLGMATILVNAGFEVAGYDNYAPSLENFRKNGGKTASSVREAAQDADVLVMMPIYLSQGESILFDDGAIDALADDAVIVLCSTCPPSGIKELGQRISKHRSSLSFVDAPVSGGAVRAAKGDLIIMASADAPESIEKVFPVLDAFASTIGNTSNLKILKGLGLGSSAKLIIQYQAGTHAGAGGSFALKLPKLIVCSGGDHRLRGPHRP
jgi:3-hydroxyisobutyrate dehydrogenase-like beta-hydroxyacid dehydrogenase